MYIIIIDNILLPVVREPVIQVESPVVPNALVISKSMSDMSIPGSSADIMKEPVSTIVSPISNMTGALRKALTGTE